RVANGLVNRRRLSPGESGSCARRKRRNKGFEGMSRYSLSLRLTHSKTVIRRKADRGFKSLPLRPPWGKPGFPHEPPRSADATSRGVAPPAKLGCAVPQLDVERCV